MVEEIKEMLKNWRQQYPISVVYRMWWDTPAIATHICMRIQLHYMNE
jgi:hypothetical protein